MPKTVEFDKDTSEQIVSLRNDGSKWDEIARAVGMPTGKAMLIYNFATTPAKQRIKNATAAQVKDLRDEENLSWGVISARTGYPESACRGLYRDAGGDDRASRVGKGGRYANGTVRPDKPAGAAKKGVAKKVSAAKKGAAAKAPAAGVLDGLDADAIKAKLEGYAIKVRND
jgi:hypothetical protein